MIARLRNDDGFTLPEALVYMVLLVVVLIVAGGLFVISQSLTADASEVSQTSDSGSVTLESVTTAVRGADWLTLATSGDDQLLTIRTIDGIPGTTDRWRCTAWFFDGSADTIYSKPVTAPITMPSNGSGWTALVSQVPNATVFSGSRSNLVVTFDVKTPDELLRFSTTASSRQPASGGTTC